MGAALEVLLAHELMRIGLKPIPSHEGPDLLIEHQSGKIWIEVICPMPTGLPSDWLEQTAGKAVNHPHEAILLRWTSAIKEKAEKLLGNANTGYRMLTDPNVDRVGDDRS